MSLLIYIISFFEGFTTLSIEIIAIRNFTPIIGTDSISTSIILGIILLALSYGYYVGGKNSKKIEKDNIVLKIIQNLTIASFYYLFFTFIFDKIILSTLLEYTQNYFFSILISSTILFFIPVFLASQTIPLLSEILKGENTGEKIGKLLFFSTIGSFLGSILTSSLLFPTIGVEKSAIFNSLLLSIIVIILSVKKIKKLSFFMIAGLSVFIFSLAMLFLKEETSQNIIFKKSNSYHNIVIYENDFNERIFSQNGGFSSGINIQTKESFFGYIKEIKEKIIENNYENILVIGAAGFTLPNELSKQNNIKNIDVVDVDASLKEIAEKYFLQEKLSDKIKFYGQSSRFFINNSIKNNKKYDAVVIDVYVGKSLSPQTLTYEFFNSIKEIGGDVYINIITDTNLKSIFSENLLKTLFASFGEIYYKNVNENTGDKTNYVMTNKKIEKYKGYKNDDNSKVYIDDKNSIEMDLFKMNNK